MANPGKIFEQDFLNSFQSLRSISIDRFYDVMGNRLNVSNPADYIVYRFPSLYYFELKSTAKASLSFSRIRPRQYRDLLIKSKVFGVHAGILINYRQLGETYYIPIQEIESMKSRGCKSIAAKSAAQIGVRLFGKVKRTRYVYSIRDFLRVLEVAYDYR